MQSSPPISTGSPRDGHIPLLEISDLHVEFQTRGGPVRAVNGVSLTLAKGQCLGLVGESGSGKSVTARSVLRLAGSGAVEGFIQFDGTDLLTLSERRMQDIRGHKISMVVQNPMSALDPMMTIGRQLTEILGRHLRLGRKAAWQRSIELLEMVGMPAPELRMLDRPHHMSGGMCQRVVIAMAIACKPQLVIADEPTTALDVTVQAQILAMLRTIQQELGTALLLISHDIGVIAGMADHVAVMYAGRIVEAADTATLFAAPRHPYTRALLASTPSVEKNTGGDFRVIAGSPPDPAALPAGCAFRPRCPHAHGRCLVTPPWIGDRQGVACWLEEPAPRAGAGDKA